MLGPERRSVEAKEATALEDAVDDGIGEIVVVQDVAPALRVLVGGEDHRPAADVAIVDDVVEDVRGVVAVRDVANLVDDKHVRLHVARDGVVKLALATRGGELLDELRRRDEQRVETVLERAVRDGDRAVRLAAPRLAFEDDRATFGDEVRREQRADRRESERRLIREVELVDGAEERECGSADRSASRVPRRCATSSANRVCKRAS